MRKVFFSSLLIWALGLACERGVGEAVEAGIVEVEAWLKAGEVVAVDVNVEEVREEYGVLPGAVLLGTASGYGAGLLPREKGRKLVFYCLNKRCTASHIAAKRAKGLGHKNTYIMSEGIQAWKEAGLPTAPP
ncbi:MAG: rhodanese-like domain-containing protein [Proteobacteria bacterium]|nr:rhodanese-like domain-containing protein [Cystobacterineae bacterium]MCL2259177.1 rhodanese-like domain-containing protein [Cystobacterineae bacterium]MCL2313794.1 rhodanese-like domain-containing protein [Pseudomonadota bacterium]